VECGHPNDTKDPARLALQIVRARGVLCGATVTTLTILAERNLTAAVLAGLAATGSAIVFFHKVIGPDTPFR
jgi:hypothetical protein